MDDAQLVDDSLRRHLSEEKIFFVPSTRENRKENSRDENIHTNSFERENHLRSFSPNASIPFISFLSSPMQIPIYSLSSLEKFQRCHQHKEAKSFRNEMNSLIENSFDWDSLWIRSIFQFDVSNCDCDAENISPSAIISLDIRRMMRIKNFKITHMDIRAVQSFIKSSTRDVMV